MNGLQDLKFAARSLRAHLGTTAFAIATLALGLGAAIVNRGGSIFEQSPATGIARDASGYTVTTPQGRIAARHVVLCSGGYTGRVVPALHRAYLPIATYMLLTEPIANITDAIDTSSAIADDRRAYTITDRATLLPGSTTPAM